jgi:phytoene dehydrogenase-like protein
VTRYDAIIIGAGHNGLTCAAYLAKSGQKVLVLEAANTHGGLAAEREFHPGFHCSVAHSHAHFPEKIVQDLKLHSHGYPASSKRLATIGLSSDQQHVVLNNGFLSGVGQADQDAFAKYRQLMHRCADALAPFWLKTMPGIGQNKVSEILTFAHIGLNIRRMGRKDMLEFLRIASLPVRDLMDEFFNNEVLKTTLGWDGLLGSKLAPRSPNAAVLAMLYRLAGENRGSHAILESGSSGLINALCKASTAAGAEIHYASPVEQIQVDGGESGLRASGVRLKSGEEISSDRVISSADPKRTFLSLVGVRYLDIGFSNRIRRLRCDGYVAKLHLALNGLPQIKGLERPDGRIIIAPTLDTIEFAFDNAKYGELPEHPVVEMVIPTLHDSSMAPNGQHVLSAHVMYVPHKLKGGWNDEKRAQICQRTIDLIAEYAPGIHEQVIHAEFMTPADLEKQYGVTGGHWHHIEMAMDQMLMMRPTYEAAQYATPIPGLYLCGAGSHPGGDITAAAGYNAAREILR